MLIADTDCIFQLSLIENQKIQNTKLVDRMSNPLPQSAPAAITNAIRQLKQQTLIFHTFGTGKSEIRTPAQSGSGEACGGPSLRCRLT